MTLLDLEEKFKQRITEAIGNLKLKDKNGKYQQVKVIKGLLPPENIMKKKNQNYGEFPFVMIRTHKYKEEKQGTVLMKIFIGICAEEENGKDRKEQFSEENYQEGHHDLLTIISKIRQNLLSNLSLDQALIKTPFELEIFLEQPFPYMYAQIDVKLEINSIKRTQYI